MKKSIFSYLTSYVPSDKREAKEDYLTQMFAWILKNIDGYLVAYVKLLYSKNQNITEVSEITDFDISTQETLPVGRIDLLIRVNGYVNFICEHKIHSELSHNQIKFSQNRQN